MTQQELAQLYNAMNELTGKVSTVETELKHKPNLWMHIVSVVGCVGTVLAVAAIFAHGMIDRNATDIRDNGKVLAAMQVNVADLPDIKRKVDTLPQIAGSLAATASSLEELGTDIRSMQSAQTMQVLDVDNLSRFVIHAFAYMQSAETIDAVQAANEVSRFVTSNDVVIAARDLEGRPISGARMREISEAVNPLLQARRASYLKMKDYHEFFADARLPTRLILPADGVPSAHDGGQGR